VWTSEQPVIVQADQLLVDLTDWRQRPHDLSTLAAKLEPIDGGATHVYPMVAADSSGRRVRADLKEDELAAGNYRVTVACDDAAWTPQVGSGEQQQPAIVYLSPPTSTRAAA
jgi:hypothetical protein